MTHFQPKGAVECKLYGVMARFQETGRTAYYYRSRRAVSISGRREVPVQEAMQRMEDLLDRETDMACPKCKGPLEDRPWSYAWRGEFFSGAYCPVCNSLWEKGEGWGQFMEAVKRSSIEVKRGEPL